MQVFVVMIDLNLMPHMSKYITENVQQILEKSQQSGSEPK
jgi:hypothetical protein